MTRFALVASVLCSAAAASAADCTRPEATGPHGIAARSDVERLNFLAGQLSGEADRARAWTLGWGAGFGVLTLAQLAATPLVKSDDQIDLYWGAASAAVGVATTILMPLEVFSVGPGFAKRARSASADEACSLIAEGERLLANGVEEEAGSRRWYIHLGNVLFNVGLGLILGLGYGHWPSGLLNTGIGIAVGEATILTSPNELGQAWKSYRDGDSSRGISVSLVSAPGRGVGLLMRF